MDDAAVVGTTEVEKSTPIGIAIEIDKIAEMWYVEDFVWKAEREKMSQFVQCAFEVVLDCKNTELVGRVLVAGYDFAAERSRNNW